jgi:hypothetical protein
MVKAKVEDLRARDKVVDDARTDLSRLVDEANDARDEFAQIVTRGRSGIRQPLVRTRRNTHKWAELAPASARPAAPRKVAGVRSLSFVLR